MKNNVNTSIDNLYYNTRNFFEGKISIDDYIKELLLVYAQVSSQTNGNIDRLSYVESSLIEIKHLNMIKNKKHMLKKKALICDICNNFAHSMNNPEYRNQLFGVKIYTIREIIKDFEKGIIKSSAYGISKDERDNKTFIVDVPEAGQISWHLKESQIAQMKCKAYKYDICKKNLGNTNLKYLTRRIKEDEIEHLDEHTKVVYFAKSYKEMNQSLQKLYMVQNEKEQNSKHQPKKIKEQIGNIVGAGQITEQDAKKIEETISVISKSRNEKKAEEIE